MSWIWLTKQPLNLTLENKYCQIREVGVQGFLEFLGVPFSWGYVEILGKFMSIQSERILGSSACRSLTQTDSQCWDLVWLQPHLTQTCTSWPYQGALIHQLLLVLSSTVEWGGGICFYGHSALLVKAHPVATVLSGSPDIFPWGFALTHSRGKVVNPPQLTGVLPAHLIVLPRFRVADVTESLTSTRYAGLSVTIFTFSYQRYPLGPCLPSTALHELFCRWLLFLSHSSVPLESQLFWGIFSGPPHLQRPWHLWGRWAPFFMGCSHASILLPVLWCPRVNK